MLWTGRSLWSKNPPEALRAPLGSHRPIHSGSWASGCLLWASLGSHGKFLPAFPSVSYSFQRLPRVCYLPDRKNSITRQARQREKEWRNWTPQDTGWLLRHAISNPLKKFLIGFLIEVENELLWSTPRDCTRGCAYEICRGFDWREDRAFTEIIFPFHRWWCQVIKECPKREKNELMPLPEPRVFASTKVFCGF